MNKAGNILDACFPGLYADIEKMLAAAEAQHNVQTGRAPSTYLLEHSRRAAATAIKIARMENVNPFLTTLVALYHDAGKFHEGKYHNDGIPEEERAALLAEKMLTDFGLRRGDILTVTEALRAMYDERLPCSVPCHIAQDADRLDKLGPMGVGSFFIRAALRGRGLVDALAQMLSLELTHTLAAPKSMFTESGRKLAAEQTGKTIAFFDQLLEQLESWGIASFERRCIFLDEDFPTRSGTFIKGMEVTIAMFRSCPDCQGSLALTHRLEKDVKRVRSVFVARFQCGSCSYVAETRIAMPVLA
jgi:HD superfamily phosphodiesterase